jgi:uncharacterized membrane protein YedE/YeeE
MNFLFNFFLGVSFGSGLILSKIFEPTTIISFLSWTENWSPTFLYALIGMKLVTAAFLLFEKKFAVTKGVLIRTDEQTYLDAKVIIGAILFGTGWGISGLCASTAVINLAFGNWQSILFFLSMIVGFYCPQFFKKVIL